MLLYLLFAINLGMIAVLLSQVRSTVFGPVTGSAVNPLLIFCIVSLFFNCDFLVVWNSRELDFLELIPLLSGDHIESAYSIYTAIFAAAFAGLIVAVRDGRNRYRGRDVYARPKRYTREEAESARFVFGATVVLSSLIFIKGLAPPYASEGHSSYQVITRDNPAVSLAVWFLIPTMALFLAHRRPRFTVSGTVLIFLVIALLVITGGARLMPLVCGFAVAVAIATSRRISPLWYAPCGIGAGVFLGLSRFVFREVDKSGPFGEYIAANGGWLKLLFGGEEISFAKMFSAVYSVAPTLGVAPFHSLEAFLVAPVPRAIFPAKPPGVSALFTELISPYRWQWTKSESLITGYGDLYVQYGVIGSCVLMFALAYCWLSVSILFIRRSEQSLVMWTPLLVWFMYAFVRGDLFNVSLLFWPTLVTLAAHRAISYMFWSLRKRLATRYQA